MPHFLIITADGKPLVNDAGTAILFRSEEQAKRWLRPGEQILRASDSLRSHYLHLPGFDCVGGQRQRPA